MHILPSKHIPFTKVPLDFMIANKLNFLKKYDKSNKNKIPGRAHEAIHGRDKEA